MLVVEFEGVAVGSDGGGVVVYVGVEELAMFGKFPFAVDEEVGRYLKVWASVPAFDAHARGKEGIRGIFVDGIPAVEGREGVAHVSLYWLG